MVVGIGKAFGMNMEDSVLNELKQDSAVLEDVLHNFTLWLFRMTIPAMCFFEQYPTDYAKRSKGWIPLKNLV